MSETQKTIAFIAAAAVALGAAWIGKPSVIGIDAPDKVGEILFPELSDPLEARRMEIVEYLPDTGLVRNFRVAQKEGLWVLPSHQDYPADAEEHLKQAATALVDLKVINVISEKKSDHKTFGVVRPDPTTTDVGLEGVGKLVTARDDGGKVLAEIIIGHEVQGQTGHRYVRAGDLDQVYVVKIDPSQMSTRFEDWVERDVLGLSAFDIQRMIVRDYSLNPTFNSSSGRITISEEPRLNLTVDFQDGEWKLVSLEEFRGGKMQPTELLPNEQLDTTALNLMKDTLDELEIVDVEPKPAGLVAGAPATDNAWQDATGIQRLFENGFYPTEGENGTVKLRSSDGEVVVAAQDGVQYTLWFGQVAGIESASDGNKLNRYVMVQASVNEDAFEKPALELTEEELAATSQPSAPADEAEEPATDAEDPSAEQTDEAAVTEETADTTDSTDEAASDEAASDEAASDEDGPADEPAVGEDTESTSEQLQAERDRKLKEYERAMDEYNAKLEAARQRVQELNFRFADWYYVVSEDEYRKIHLGRSDVVMPAEDAAAEGDQIDAFRMLEQRGLTHP